MVGKKRERVTYFFLNQRLHKLLHISKATDVATTWDYAAHRRKAYIWSDVQRSMQRAFTLRETSAIFSRHRNKWFLYAQKGYINSPQKAYSLTTDRTINRFFSEDDLYMIHDYLSTVHRGRPRKDGLITTYKVPTRAELRAIINRDTILYVKNDSGEFIPVFKERMWNDK